ncbi:MAG: SDR family oxidoreductase [Armatimonadota bacterium]|nr:SDR family oxidoreductase [Armatimonadota bacterium]MDR5703402.1 SDR family oxidoreductase [Armatimonadota bacterium]
MRVLVTGGAGFIGSHLVDASIASGYEVIVVDDLSSGRRENVHPRAKFYQVDIASNHLGEVFAEERPEIVVHHAAQASVVRSVQEPRYDAMVNVLGTVQILEQCVRWKVRKVVFASTGGAIYGEPISIPVTEDHPIAPISPYGITKYIGELYLAFYHRAYGLPYVSLRYANVYGPRQDPTGEAGVVAIFIDAMLRGRAPTIFGDGTQTRDFVYVEDVVQANLLAMQLEVVGVMNIGTGVETSVNLLYAKLAQLTGFTDPPVYAAPRPGDVYRIALDPDRARSLLGWRPKVTLEEGLRRTVEAFKEQAAREGGG